MPRFILAALLVASCVTLAQAQNTATLARELVTLKGGYADKKKQFEEVRIRAYVPMLLKAVGKGPAWKPGHPNWAETEQRIAGEWRQYYLDHLARMGRVGQVGPTGQEPLYGWMDEAVAREYARLFDADELGALLIFYGSPAGATLLALEKEFLEFYPREVVRSLTRVLFGNEALSAREQAQFRAPENRERREFAALFETENMMVDECERIGGKYVEGSFPAVPQGALATAADLIDALRRKLDAATLSELHAFLKSTVGRKERAFVGAEVPVATPTEEDPARVIEEQAAFYKGLQRLSAQWRELAAKTAAQ